MRFISVAILVIAVAVFASAIPTKHGEQFEALSDEMVNHINSLKTTWTAAKTSRFASVKDVIRTLGALPEPAEKRPPLKVVEIDLAAIPTTFDARTNWPNCDSIKDVRDQSACGSCWAFGAAEAMSDRICIASNGTLQTRISSEDLLSCCTSCGNGCNGGYLGASWDYFKNKGLVTGFLYNATGYCRDYSFPPCAHHEPSTKYPDCPSTDYNTPSCVRKCDDASYNKSYTEDLHYGASSYTIGSSDAAIQTEIMTHGPVEAAFTVYSDFPTYRSGVYQHTSGSVLGGHAIKILGWGVENNVNYWLVANSWNESWGDNGFFKIKRGDCGINSQVTAGLPKL